MLKFTHETEAKMVINGKQGLVLEQEPLNI